MKRILYLISLCSIIIGSTFLVSNRFVNSENTPKFYFFIISTFFFSITLLLKEKTFRIPNHTLGIILTIGIGGVLSLYSKVVFSNLMISIFCIILLLFICQYVNELNSYSRNVLMKILFTLGVAQGLYGLSQYTGWLPSRNLNFSITGSFNNPAGFASLLALTLPIGAYFVINSIGLTRRIYISACLIIAFLVVLSGSRAGMLAILISLALLISLKTKIFHFLKNWSSFSKIILIPGICIIFLTGLYFVKKNSADGRLLIWSTSLNMIRDKPLAGFGPNGFKASYMLYQGKYFKKHPDSRFKLLADNVNHPFNEFLLVLVEYGIIGLLILLSCIFLIVRWIMHSNHPDRFLTLSGLSAIIVLAFFAHPFQYVPIWILVISYLSMISINNKVIVMNNKNGIVLKATITGISLIFLVVIMKNLKAELIWKEIAIKSINGETKMLSEYEKVYRVLSNNPYFLYNYAAELNNNGKFQKSIEILNKCVYDFNDYDLQLLFGDNFMQLKKYSESEKYFQQATYMIPNRFWPFYQLYKLYLETGRKDEAILVAQHIVNKEIKIPSPIVYSIKSEMNTFLKGNLLISPN